MVRVEVLQRKSLFSLLHVLDVDLAETARKEGCPTAGVRCIELATSVSPEAAPLIFRKSTPLA